MRAVIQGAAGKALLVLEEPVVWLSTTIGLSTTPVVAWGRGRCLRAAEDPRSMP